METTAEQQSSPLRMAKALYIAAGRGDKFVDDLAEYLRNGVVYSSPLCFAMFRATVLEDGLTAWWVECAAGHLPELARLAPCELPFIAFCRRGQTAAKVYPFAKFIRRIAGAKP